MRFVIAAAALLMTAAPVHVLGLGKTPAFPFHPSTATDCNWWFDNEMDVVACKDIPATVGITAEEFFSLNPSIDKKTCTPYKKNQSYCIGVCKDNCWTKTTVLPLVWGEKPTSTASVCMTGCWSKTTVLPLLWGGNNSTATTTAGSSPTETEVVSSEPESSTGVASVGIIAGWWRFMGAMIALVVV